MPEVKSQPVDKLSMSRALGAAFLSHQVEQLERSITEKDQSRNKQSFGGRGRPRTDSRSKRYKETRRSREETTDRPRGDRKEVDADVLVTDASILIYGLSHLKQWSRDGREKIVIVPLEALNTLDALKKGSTVTARLARAASRFLEQQVGNNNRVRVQRDDAFVPWEDLLQKPEAIGTESPTPTAKDGSDIALNEPAPEWLRRILCCVAFERKEFGKDNPISKVVLATSTPPESGSPVYNASIKFDRASGILIRSWANEMSIPVINVEPDALTPPPAAAPKPVSRDKPPMVEKPATTLDMENVSVNTGNGRAEEGQGKVIRLLTRGSKLDP